VRLKNPANDETAQLADLRRQIAAAKRELEHWKRLIEDAQATRDAILMQARGLKENPDGHTD
jgi:AmiR/NasT family two-component response regulator